MTGAVLQVDIRGRDGKSLRDHWQDGPRTYLGLTVAGFPNLFTVTGPQSPSVLTNMTQAIEQHCEWITNCIKDLRDTSASEIEASETAETDWVAHVAELSDGTLKSRTSSWYTGQNIAGKPVVFMPYLGGLPRYRAACDDVANNGYTGFKRV